MRRAHGQSPYTPDKQRHLQMMLHGCTRGWKTLSRIKPSSLLVAIDCTAGSGHSDDGKEGSPLIINRHFNEKYDGRFRQLCCEEKQAEYTKLAALPFVNCDVIKGSYQDIVPRWLAQFGGYRSLHGLLYIDPNGMIDALEGIDLLKSLQANERFDRIDLLFNISLNAYKRHKAVGSEWATKPLIEHLDTLAHLKEETFIRSERGGLKEWIMLYGMNTGKVSLRRPKEGMTRYEDWRENAEFYLNGGQKVSVNQMRLI